MKSLSTMIVFLLGMMSFGLNGMERPAQPSVVVDNKTADKIVVIFQHQGQEKPITLTLTAGQSFNIGNPSTLQLLKITIYGRYKGWLSAYALSFGLWGLENLAPEVQESSKKLGTNQLGVGVEYGAPGYKGWVKPYKFIVGKAGKTAESRYCYLWQNFDQVKAASLAGKKIEARYFLNLPEKKVSEAEIEDAYRLARNRWLPELKNLDKEKVALAADALKLIDAAYWSLVKGGESAKAFEDMVNEEEQGLTVFQCPVLKP